MSQMWRAVISGCRFPPNRPVAEDLARVFPATLEMATLGIIIGVVLGVPTGVWAAAKQGTWVDQIIRVFALLGYSVPAFWAGSGRAGGVLRRPWLGRGTGSSGYLLRGVWLIQFQAFC